VCIDFSFAVFNFLNERYEAHFPPQAVRHKMTCILYTNQTNIIYCVCLFLSVEVDRVPLYQLPKRVSEATILPVGDPLKSHELSTACHDSDILTEGPKEITETVRSNKPSLTSCSNGVKVSYVVCFYFLSDCSLYVLYLLAYVYCLR